jgi:hypothetical protein
MSKQTFKATKAALKAIGITLSKTSNFPNEYRVNLLGGTEATAYYTNDLTDALGTGISMAEAKHPTN